MPSNCCIFFNITFLWKLVATLVNLIVEQHPYVLLHLYTCAIIHKIKLKTKIDLSDFEQIVI